MQLICNLSDDSDELKGGEYGTTLNHLPKQHTDCERVATQFSGIDDNTNRMIAGSWCQNQQHRIAEDQKGRWCFTMDETVYNGCRGFLRGLQRGPHFYNLTQYIGILL